MRPILAEFAFKSESGFGDTLGACGVDDADHWRSSRAAADDLRRAIAAALGDGYGGEVAKCSTELLLQSKVLSDERTLSVRPAYSCRKRWCPVCEWRKSRKRWGLIMSRMPDLLRDQPPLAWLMLTLTVRNCDVADLKATVADMLKAFRLMTRRKDWPALGWLRSVEITFPRPGEAHPHLHVLIAVPARYFKGEGYLKQSDWTDAWKKAAKLTYTPVVDVRRVKAQHIEGAPQQVQEALGGVREVSKYVTKPADLANNPADAVEALASLKNVRLMDAGGFLRGILSQHDDDDEEAPQVETIARYWWRAVERQYRRKL